MLIVGISGDKGAGKDKTCELLLDMFPGRGFRCAFADMLKQEVAEVCGVSMTTISQNKHLFRPMLQWWGTEFRRQFQGDDLYWINKLDRQRVEQTGIKDLMVIPDLRYPNEYEYIRRKRGITIRVERNTVKDSTSHHSSETALLGFQFDFTLPNHGTVEDLHRAMHSLIFHVTHRLVDEA